MVGKFVTLSALTIQTTASVTLDGPAPFYVYDFKRHSLLLCINCTGTAAAASDAAAVFIVTLIFMCASRKPPPTRLPLMPTVIYE